MKTECLYNGEFKKKSWLDVVSDCQSWLNNSVKQVEKVSALEIHFHPSKISDKRSIVEELHLRYLKETVGKKYKQYNKLKVVKFKNRIHTADKWNAVNEMEWHNKLKNQLTFILFTYRRLRSFWFTNAVYV